MDLATSIRDWRLFWAVPLTATPALLQAFVELKRWQTVLRISRAEQFHLTMKFLGDTAPERTDELVEAGRSVVLGDRVPPVVCEGAGVFPPRGRPNVIWTGLTGAEPLVELANRLDNAMCQLGYAPERRPFRPHLTLARIKGHPPRPLLNWLEQQRTAVFGEIPVRELTLFRSELTPTGSIYTPVAQLPLSA
jgi:2'-5' RNA ligase